jgi:hypothetical protein
MTAPAGSRRPVPATRYLSGARLDSTTFALMVDAAAVRAAIADLDPRLSLARPAEVAAGKHPIVVDLFRVSEGRLDLGAIDQHQWTGGAGAMAGALCGAGVGGTFGAAYGGLTGATMGGYVGRWLGPAGWLAGAATGWMGGCMLGAMSGLAPGVVRGAMLGAKGAAGASQRWSEIVGNYEEVLIGVPDVVMRGDRAAHHNFFVLQMYTDSALARWGDRAFAFGYRKQMAHIRHDLFRSFRVEDNQHVVLDGAFANDEPTSWQSASQATPSPRLFATLRQPLLAVTEDGRLARSRLERDLTASDVRIATGAVRVGGNFAPGVPAQELRLGDGSGKQAWAGFHTRKIMSRVSYPTHLPAHSPAHVAAHRRTSGARP